VTILVLLGLSLGNTAATIHAIFKKYAVIEKAVIYGSRVKSNYKQGADI
jgi:hypothetical protein